MDSSFRILLHRGACTVRYRPFEQPGLGSLQPGLSSLFLAQQLSGLANPMVDREGTRKWTVAHRTRTPM